MAIEDNKRIVQDLWSAVSSHDLDRIGSIYDENVVYHGPAGEEAKGRAAAVGLAKMYLDAFPDMSMTVEQIVAEGDFVVARVRAVGTHKGELMGIAPTSRRVDLRWISSMMRLANGKVAEEWEIFDNADFMKQLGVG